MWSKNFCPHTVARSSRAIVRMAFDAASTIKDGRLHLSEKSTSGTRKRSGPSKRRTSPFCTSTGGANRQSWLTTSLGEPRSGTGDTMQ